MSYDPNPYASPLTASNINQPVNQLPLASLGKRFLGALADGFAGLVFIGPGYALLFAGGAMSEGQNEPSPLMFVGLGLVALGALALLVIQLYLLATRSQSIGKYLVKTQIWDVTTNQPAGLLKTLVLRGIVNGIIGAIPCVGPIYSLVDIFFIFREDRRCIHDLIASTVVLDIE